MRLLAKGTRRAKSKSGGAIDLLAEGELVFIARSAETLGTLVEFTETVSHAALRRDATRLNIALYIIELVGEMLPQADPHPEVFDLLSRVRARLAEEGAPTAAVLAYFQWRLLRHAGLLGDLSRCVSCGGAVQSRGRAEAYFSSRKGGVLCGACESASVEKFRIDGATLAGIAALAAAESGAKVNLPDRQARSVSRMLAYHIREQLGKPLKMARHAIG